MSMLRKVQVWNKGDTEYVEDFKDVVIKIPAKSFIVMEDSEASQFIGKFRPFIRDGQGRDLSTKPLQKVYITDGMIQTAPESHNCMACKQVFTTAPELAEHSKVHAAQLIKEPEDKKAKGKGLFA